MRRKFLYSARPSKHVERTLIVDACRHLGTIAPLPQYEYVGFGALEFLDFDLFHRALDIRVMTSIEKDGTWPDRYEFNKPFKGVTVLIGRASDHLPVLDWSGLRIVWLDYTDPLTKEVVRDCETVARVLIPGSVLIVTVNAGAPYLKRLDALAKNLHPDDVPAALTEEQLASEWSFAAAQRQILIDRLEPIMSARADQAELRQFLNFCHQDDARMQTVGWIVSSPGLDQVIGSCGIESRASSRTGDDPFVIKVPALTFRETQYLNRRLPLAPGEHLDETWLDGLAQAEYASLYRWYPSLV